MRMAKATIKSKTGALITVEGSESEVSNILSVFERTAAVGHAKEVVAKRQTVKKKTKTATRRFGLGDQFERGWLL
jgi:hypothetical protein